MHRTTPRDKRATKAGGVPASGTFAATEAGDTAAFASAFDTIAGTHLAGPQPAGIPRDAKGNPVFLVLPPGVEAGSQRYLASCERHWQETGDPAALGTALTHVHLLRRLNLPPTCLQA